MSSRTGLAALLLMAVATSAPATVVGNEVNENAPGFGLQPRHKSISVCFYGNAVTKRPARVAEIRQWIESWFEGSGNLGYSFEGACQAATTQKCGSGADLHDCPYFQGDLRIAIQSTEVDGQSVGQKISATDFPDCDDLGAYASWGVSPHNVDKPGYRACPYNAAIWDDGDAGGQPWLNHTLHEVGHTMALVHEFAHSGFQNVTGPDGTLCASSVGVTPGGLIELTPMDIWSVMQYEDLSCGMPGNFGHQGLSPSDRLGLHILYAEDDLVAEWTGVTVLRTGQKLQLWSTLALRGANLPVAIREFSWVFGGLGSTASSFSTTWLSAGTRWGTFRYTDFLGRKFSAPIEVRVLAPNDFAAQIAAPIAACGGLL